MAGSAKAYAFVNASNCGGSPVLCTLEKSKNIVSAQRVSTGTYCITAAPGIGTATVSIAGVDFRHTSAPEGAGNAMSDATNAACAAGQFEVFTERGDAGTAANDVAFWFAVL